MRPTACFAAVLSLAVLSTAETRAQNFPRLTVTEPQLGTHEFEGAQLPLEFDILAGMPLDFSWVGDASGYGGQIVAYRYAWNLRNPAEDAWDQEWSVTVTSAATRSFNSGTQQFLLQAQDDAGSITQAGFRLTVHSVLLVLSVTETNLGTWAFSELSFPVVQLHVEPSTELNFSWSGDATFHGGTVEAYRYGWDITNLADDAQWTEWCACLSAPTQSFDGGSHTLHLQARDDTGVRGAAVIRIDVGPVAVESASWSAIKRRYRVKR